MKCHFRIITLLTISLFLSCSRDQQIKRKVLAIPVYGQSLALGEEAVRVTDFELFVKRTNHSVVTENLDEEFGYFSDTHSKQWLKKILGDRSRSFELSVYGMSEAIIDYFSKEGNSENIIICTFPGGRGATGINDLGRGSAPYKKFLEEIKGAYDKAQDNGWDFVVPAFCWMQGENDIMWNSKVDYKRALKNFQFFLNRDIKAITKQKQDVVCISYQTNCVSLSQEFDNQRYVLKETLIPQGQMELIRDEPLFMASGPTYPYSFCRERVHIDGQSQKRLGYLAGLSVVRLLQSKPSKGLIPLKFRTNGNEVFIEYNLLYPPLVLDTVLVSRAKNFGFSVIDSNDVDILQRVNIKGSTVELQCKNTPIGSKVRYAINGVKGKSGSHNGPRGNLRDSQGQILTAEIEGNFYPLHNWSYQFDVTIQ